MKIIMPTTMGSLKSEDSITEVQRNGEDGKWNAYGT